jgi:hypothetical protein
MNFNLIFIQFLISGLLTGLIWIVQIVHYPSFRFIDSIRFKDFHKFHSFRISLIVVTLMLSELGLGIFWIFEERNFFSYTNFAFLIIIWIGTFLLSVPIHSQLSFTFDLDLIDRLVNTNWLRTIAWSLKLSLLGFFILENFLQ